jgi:hypothetical protein
MVCGMKIAIDIEVSIKSLNEVDFVGDSHKGRA